MRSSHEHCACDMKRAREDDSFEKRRKSADLEHTKKSVCVCDTCEVRCTDYTWVAFKGMAIPASETLVKQSKTYH